MSDIDSMTMSAPESFGFFSMLQTRLKIPVAEVQDASRAAPLSNATYDTICQD
jgi:hypothetical protein